MMDCIMLYLLIQFLHADQVNTLETVTIGSDEVETDMDPGVSGGRQVPLDLELLLEPSLKLAVNIVHYGLETVLFVDLITISHCVHQSQLQINIALLKYKTTKKFLLHFNRRGT